ncbi:MAG: phosphate ABC transporter permease PstA, partial [Peptococcaceae bacterium]|nr:phosphate ABC transporter permease PstA [Peptococcaceae bacterium]
MAKRNLAGHVACWFSGVFTLLICLAILVFLVIKGANVIDWQFLIEDPKPSLDEGLSGGVFSPIIGTLLLTTLGIIFALPWAMATALYLAEYAGDNHWVKLLRTGIDVLAGVPTIVFAIFGLAIFSHPKLAFLSTSVEGVENAKAFGRSFLVAAITMAMMVLPYVTKSMEEAIRAVPATYKEAAYALGVSRWRTIRRVVLPAAAAGIVTGAVLGVGRIAGDTAIVWLCLGGSMTLTGPQPWWAPQNWLDTLQNTGSTLTSFIYYSSPAGEGNAPNKAFGAGLV